MTEDKMVGWHHQLSEHEFQQTSGDGEVQGSQHTAAHGIRVGHDFVAEQQQQLCVSD